MAKRPKTGGPRPPKGASDRREKRGGSPKPKRKTTTRNKPSRSTPKRKDHKKHNGSAGEPWHRVQAKRKRRGKIVPRLKRPAARIKR